MRCFEVRRTNGGRSSRPPIFRCNRARSVLPPIGQANAPDIGGILELACEGTESSTAGGCAGNRAASGAEINVHHLATHRKVLRNHGLDAAANHVADLGTVCTELRVAEARTAPTPVITHLAHSNASGAEDQNSVNRDTRASAQ